MAADCVLNKQEMTGCFVFLISCSEQENINYHLKEELVTNPQLTYLSGIWIEQGRYWLGCTFELALKHPFLLH